MSTPPNATTPSSATPAPVDATFDRASLRASAFTWRAAFSLAVASELAYEDRDVVRSIGQGTWGFSSCELVEEESTQCLVAQDDQLVLLAFRGTESWADVLTDGNLLPTDGISGAVHRGFFGAFTSIESKVLQQVGALKDRALILTGHSLGGALAVVAAGQWRTTKSIHWISTYGQPAVGDRKFRDNLFSSFAGRYFRFVNNKDVVPRIPPGYEHAGRLLQFSADGRLVVGSSLPKTALSLKTGGFAAMVAELATAAASITEEWQVGDAMLSVQEVEQLRAKLNDKLRDHLHLDDVELLDKIPNNRTFKKLSAFAESSEAKLEAFGIGDPFRPVTDHFIANYIKKIKPFV